MKYPQRKREMENDEIVIYQSDDGTTRLAVHLTGETVWLSQQQLCDLYQTSRSNIVEHIRHIYAENELEEISTCRKFRQVRQEGSREVSRELPFYNLDMILSLGYRVKSKTATHFRHWASERLKEYIIKGFSLDDERLKGSGGGEYWRELLNRIREIRSSEKVMYRQVLDLYATAVDYDPKDETTLHFFKMVQNKLHFAAHGHTAAEVIYDRANGNADFMGLTTFKGDHPTLAEAKTAKNYLSAEELKILNNLVSGYFDFAEIQAMKRQPMYMTDYVEHLDTIIKAMGEKVLTNGGNRSHQEAMEKAEREYRIYQVRTLTPVEKAYLETLNKLASEVKNQI